MVLVAVALVVVVLVARLTVVLMLVALVGVVGMVFVVIALVGVVLVPGFAVVLVLVAFVRVGFLCRHRKPPKNSLLGNKTRCSATSFIVTVCNCTAYAILKQEMLTQGIIYG